MMALGTHDSCYIFPVVQGQNDLQHGLHKDVEFWGRKIRKYSFGDYNNEQMMQIR